MNNVDLFERLSSVTHFSVKVEAENQWHAQGEGAVEADVSDQRLVWQEKGRWDSTLDNLDFSNSYRWTLVDKNEIQLEHLRYGIQQPVQLVTIEAQQDDSWKSTQPHQCGQDSYQLDLKVYEDCLILSWLIKGPNKNQLSTICYR